MPPLRERPLRGHETTGALAESLPEEPPSGQTRKKAALNPLAVSKPSGWEQAASIAVRLDQQNEKNEDHPRRQQNPCGVFPVRLLVRKGVGPLADQGPSDSRIGRQRQHRRLLVSLSGNLAEAGECPNEYSVLWW